MDNAAILEELQPIFRDVFDNEHLQVRDETDASMIEDWDSLAHINLVTAIEQSFGVKFALAELEDLKNVGDMVELIRRRRSNE